ncbi:MAG: hypothetical protein QXP38_08210 [Nitrososphaerota archaeon]
MDRKVEFGFSSFEVLVSIAILLILSYIGTKQFAQYKASRDLMRQANMLEDELAWIKSISPTQDVSYGIVISSGSYTIFKDKDADCKFTSNDDIVRIVPFITGIVASSNTTTIITFDRRGQPRDQSCGLGIASITLQGTNNNTITLDVSKYGRLRIK